MSSLTTTTINTKDGLTNLTVGTANTLGPRIVVGSNNTVWIANSTANSFISNGSNINIPVTLNVNGAVTFSNSLSMSGSLVVNSSGSFTDISATGNATITGSVSAARLSAANATITTNTFTLGTSNSSASGFTRLPNGLLYQWGTVLADSGSGTITFPTSFSTVYSIVATSNTAVATYQAGITSVSTTSASVRTANTSSRTVYWMAIGV